MRNPYQVLGVSPQSGPDEIKAAYRRLAKTYHPDSGQDDPSARDRFHEIASAYELLRRKEAAQRANAARAGASRAAADREARREARATRTAQAETRSEQKPASQAKTSAKTDMGTKTAETAETAKSKTDGDTAANTRPFSEWKPRSEESVRASVGDPATASNDGSAPRKPVFADFLSQIKSAGRRALGGRHTDHIYEVNIPFSDAVKGTKRRVTLQNGKSLDVHVPAGVEDGQQIRLRGQGASNLASRETGDAFVRIAIAPHPVFKREGADIYVDASISLPEAVLGSKITVPTVDGDVQVSVPEGSNSGSILRLKGKGLQFPPGKRRLGRGDQYVTLTLVLPDKIDDQLKDFAATWAPGLQHRPRKG